MSPGPENGPNCCYLLELKFKKTGADKINWKGKLNVGQSVVIENLPVTVDVGGVRQTFRPQQEGRRQERRRQQVEARGEAQEGRDEERAAREVLLPDEGRLQGAARGIRADRRRRGEGSGHGARHLLR